MDGGGGSLTIEPTNPEQAYDFRPMMLLCSPALGGYRSSACQEEIRRYYRKWYESKTVEVTQTGYAVVCWTVDYGIVVLHCEIRGVDFCVGKWLIGKICFVKPIPRNYSCEDRLGENGPRCCDATDEEVRSCFRRWLGWHYDSFYFIHDNCMTSTQDTIDMRCGVGRSPMYWWIAITRGRLPIIDHPLRLRF